jgi:hypothetical protein
LNHAQHKNQFTETPLATVRVTEADNYFHIVIISKLTLEIGYEDMNLSELAKDLVQWKVFVFAVLNFWVLLSAR